MKMKQFACWAFLSAAAWAGLAACGEPVAPDPAHDVYGTYDLVLWGNDPLPFVQYNRLNYNRLNGGTLSLVRGMEFERTWDAVGNLWHQLPLTGTFRVSGDSVVRGELPVLLRHEGQALVSEYGGEVWVKRGVPVPPRYRYETYQRVRPSFLGPSLAYPDDYVWLWEDGSFRHELDTYYYGIWGTGGTYEIRSDTLLVLSTPLAVTDRSAGELTEGVLKYGVLHIGQWTYVRR